MSRARVHSDRSVDYPTQNKRPKINLKIFQKRKKSEKRKTTTLKTEGCE
jgi:hypothetical protein